MIFSQVCIGCFREKDEILARYHASKEIQHGCKRQPRRRENYKDNGITAQRAGHGVAVSAERHEPEDIGRS